MRTLHRGRRFIVSISLLAILTPSAVCALSPDAADQPKTAEAGYLATDDLPDMTRVLGPPPAEGSGTKAGDVATFKATRRLEGSPRWSLAARDAVFGVNPMMEDFSCALGKSINQQTAPKLAHLISRVSIDGGALERAVKNTYRRARPFVEEGGRICVPVEPWLQKSYSYPSGHATFSWTVALILSEIVPAQSASILARARSYGESRVVCGVHYSSDVQAGRVVGAVLFAQLQDNQAFRRDLKLSEEEFRGLEGPSSHAPDPQSCVVETEAAAEPVW